MNKVEDIIRTAYQKYYLWQTPTEVKKFAEFYHELDCKNILEIGSLYGGNFYVLCKLSNDKGKKITIDYPESDEQIHNMEFRNTIDNIDRFSDDVHIIRNDSHLQETFDKVKEILDGEELDFIFIDGDHSYVGVKQDYEMYKSLLKEGGYIAFHDINDTEIHKNYGNEVHKLWSELPNDYKLEFNEHGPYMGIGVVKHFKHKKSINVEIQFEYPNKVILINHGDPVPYIISLKDKDTGIPIYYCDIPFDKCNSFWVLPGGVYNYADDIYFGGFRIEFYDKDKNFVDAKEIEIRKRDTPIIKDITREFSPFDCLYFNYRQMFYDKLYDKLDLSDVETVIDIGANVGLFSTYMSRKPNVKLIHAIEPTSKAYDQLIKQFYYYQGVKCHKLGIHSFTGKSAIKSNEDNSCISSFVHDTGSHTTNEEVDVMTLSDFMHSQTQMVDLVKIDVEGLEYDILKATSDTDILMIKKFLIEYHPVDNQNVSELILRLEKLGYTVSKYPDHDPIYGFIFACRTNNSVTEQIQVRELPKKAFVTFTNENYLPLTEQLVQSVLKFSKYPILVYSINCNVPFQYPNLYVKRIDSEIVKTPKYVDSGNFSHRKGDDLDVKIDTSKYDLQTVDRNDLNTYITLSRKGLVILDAISNGLEQGIFLDADGLVKENIDSSFTYFNECENYPLVGKGLFEYMMLNGKGDPAVGDPLEKPLMDLLGVKDRTMHYVSTNFILFTNKMKEFFTKLTEISNHPKILEDNVHYTPYHDETLINVLLWKYGATKHLPVVHFNLLNLLKAIEFYNTDERNSTLDTDWQYIPENKKDIKYFHGCKSIDELKKIITYMEKKSEQRYFKHMGSPNSSICIVTLYDEHYMEAAPYSIKNKKIYADLNGYDLIYFDDIIDKDRPPQWSKVQAIQAALSKYDWVWWIDIDAMIMNFSIKLEDIIDENFDMIFTRNEYSFISNGSSFFKNSELTHKFLNQVYTLDHPELQKIDIQSFDHEQKAMRVLLQNDVDMLRRTKLIDERICNSYYPTLDYDVLRNYPNWNTSSNLYQEGDFVVQFCGRTFGERLRLIKKFHTK
jgi:FkbM family methyltransferase